MKILIKTITRKKDMFSKYEDLQPLFQLKKFPVYMGVTDDGYETDEFVDMKWMISTGSGMVQCVKVKK